MPACDKANLNCIRAAVDSLIGRLELAVVGIFPTEGDSVDFIRCELSECGVNVIRDCAADKGWSGTDSVALLREELDRIKGLGLPASAAGLQGYLRARRGGSRFRITRNVRRAVFAQLVSKNLV